MFGENLKHFGETASTNDDAMVWARADGEQRAPHGSVVRADSQTCGRGRLGRDWISPPDLGLYISLILRPEIEMTYVPQLTMLAALAAADAVENMTQLRAQVKWPNDIVLHNKKIGGVLSEAQNGAENPISSTRFVEFVVIGIGLNVNFGAGDLPRDAKIPASSLRLESGDLQSCDALFQNLMFALQSRYETYERDGFELLRREFERKDILQNRAVRVETERETYRGRAISIADDGVLVVQTERGARRVVAGDVKLEETL